MRKWYLTITMAFVLLFTMALLQKGEAKSATENTATRACERAESGRLCDADRSEIMDLISRYSHTVDSRDIEGFVSLFIDDCRWVANLPENPIVLDSRTKLREYLAKRLKYFADNSLQTRHVQTNTILTRISADRVQGVTYLTLLGQVKGEAAPRAVSTGIYRDEFIKTENGWRFAVREATLDQGKLPKVE